MKTILIALGMAAILFIYGYFFSTAGHDHSSHGKVSTEEENHTSDHKERSHDHDHH